MSQYGVIVIIWVVEVVASEVNDGNWSLFEPSSIEFSTTSSNTHTGDKEVFVMVRSNATRFAEEFPANDNNLEKQFPPLEVLA